MVIAVNLTVIIYWHIFCCLVGRKTIINLKINIMSERESDFLNDVENAVSCWSYTSDSYHEDGGFIVEITIDDEEEWAEDESEIWDALS